jgi:TPP-dependent pyruvate/acetoin dehydrogenase alpha subunit
MRSLRLYQKLYLIRKSEEAIIERYMDDEMKTPMHLSIGQEAISAAVIESLTKSDQVVGTYRSHGIYLAKTLETDKFFAELYGRSTGSSKGKAGSMHLSSAEHGYLGSSAIVATHLPVALGAAMANKIKGNDNWVAVFFGDGAIDEGVFFETMNFACLHGLRLIFVCEDNGLAIHSHASTRHGYESISDIIRQYNCHVIQSDSTVADELFELVDQGKQEALKKNQPLFLHFECFRYLEHVGINEDYEAGYRERSEYNKWKEKDPIKLQREIVAERYGEHTLQKVEAEIDEQILNSIKYAEGSPFPPASDLLAEVFSPDTQEAFIGASA